MPRLPKPARLRQNHERQDFGLISLAAGGLEVPQAPRGLLVQTVREWDAFWTSPLALTVTPATDLPAITRLFALRDERERMARVVRLERVVVGSRGQPRANPLYAQIASFDAEIRQLEDRLGLTPLARLKLGVTFGDAARSLADLNAELAGDAEDSPEDADLLLTLAAGSVAEPRPGGDRVYGAEPRPRPRRHPR